MIRMSQRAGQSHATASLPGAWSGMAFEVSIDRVCGRDAKSGGFAAKDLNPEHLTP